MRQIAFLTIALLFSSCLNPLKCDKNHKGKSFFKSNKNVIKKKSSYLLKNFSSIVEKDTCDFADHTYPDSSIKSIGAGDMQDLNNCYKNLSLKTKNVFKKLFSLGVDGISVKKEAIRLQIGFKSSTLTTKSYGLFFCVDKNNCDFMRVRGPILNRDSGKTYKNIEGKWFSYCRVYEKY